jgi:uncharacterized protein with predicted RNA binding PUA domain
VTTSALQKIRAIADYQFGRGVGEVLFPEQVHISFSRKTGRIRHIYLDTALLATLRPTDGFFSLAIAGARRILKAENFHSWVEIDDEVGDFVAQGRSAFAKHVVECDDEIRAAEEVVVVDGRHEVLAVGRAVLTGKEMKAFERGVAVRVRHGTAEGREKAKKESRN